MKSSGLKKKKSTMAKKKPEGIALVITLVMLTVLFVMGVTFISVSGRDYIFARQTLFRNQAYYLAESGVEYAMNGRINWITYPHHEEFDYSDGHITIDAVENGNNVTITSRGEYNNYRRTIVVTFDRNGRVILWEES